MLLEKVQDMNRKDPMTVSVALAVFRHAKDNGRAVTCFPSVKRVAEVAGVSVRKAQSALRRLENQGVIERRYRPGGPSKLTTLFV